LNYLLSIKKKYILLAIFIFLIIVIVNIFIQSIYFKNNITDNSINFKNSESDIIKPKFSISSNTRKIFITADEGSFLKEGEILLKKNVMFNANKFKIFSDNVRFNKKNQTASSITKSKFISNKTEIISEGFEINDFGNKINFNGKTILNIKWTKFIR